MEKAPSERKPNRRFRGRMHFAIREAFGWRQTPVESRDIGYEPVGIGAMDVGNLTVFETMAASDPRRFDDPFPNNWPEQGNRS